MSHSKVNQYLESKDWRRKRDNQGNLIDSLEKRHFVPFKCEVPAGTSAFEIQVPKTYLNQIIFHLTMSSSFLICTPRKLNRLTKKLKKS
jgi:hypothetical protein